MMDIWTIPFIIVVITIIAIGVISAQKSSRAAIGFLNERDAEIPKVIENHPYTLNPIFWIILVAALFIGIIIFYYAFSSGLRFNKAIL